MDNAHLDNANLGGVDMSSTSAKNATFNNATLFGKCESCNLAGVYFTGRDLSGIQWQHTNLTGAHFSNSNLSKADLRFANLQGAYLDNTNLESANLCGASLNAGSTGTAADLTGAHLKNANLSGANLDSATFTHASFYSSSSSADQPDCSTYTLPTSASAYKASINNAKFDDAYLAGVNMDNVTGNSVNFNSAILFGASFKNATLNNSGGSGGKATFISAFLQGADFTGASINYGSFYSAYIDVKTDANNITSIDSSNNCRQTLLLAEQTGFPGFKKPVIPKTTPPSCVTGIQQTPTCISFSYAAGKAVPLTDSNNTCPDGNTGPCTPSQWTSPVTPPAIATRKSSACKSDTSDPPAICKERNVNTCW
jgi:uncharacterized protein YjbI with pentapeptide repeats